MLRCVFAYLQLLFTRKKKQSCLVIPTFEAFGGTRTYFISLIKFLSKQRYEITVMLSPSQSDEEILALQLKYPFTIEPLQFDVWRTSFSRPISSRINKTYFLYQLQELLYFWRVLRRTRSSVLICSISNPEELLFLFLSPLKMMYVLHTSTMDTLDRVKRTLLHFSLSKKKQIVTVSNFAKELLLKNWMRGKKAAYIEVVYNYYEPKKNLEAKNTAYLASSILTLGTVVSYKNPIFWIEVCKTILSRQAQPVTFIWAGDGPLLDTCRKLTANIPQIQFIGFRNDVDELYAKSSIYFQPSIQESQGMSVLGAMYYAKPCIVSNRGGLPESVINNETGYVVEIDAVEEAAAAIGTLVQSSYMIKRFGEEGRRRFDKFFTREGWESKMISVLCH